MPHHTASSSSSSAIATSETKRTSDKRSAPLPPNPIELFDDFFAKLSARGLTCQDFQSYTKDNVDVLLTHVFGYSLIERKTLRAELARRGTFNNPPNATATSILPDPSTGSDPIPSTSSSSPSGPSVVTAQKAKLAATDEDVPEEFICPILREIMDDPVFTGDGHTYSREGILQWFARFAPGQLPTSPVTGLPLPHNTLVDNHSMRSQIVAWRQKTGRPPPPPRPVQPPPPAPPPSNTDPLSSELASLSYNWRHSRTSGPSTPPLIRSLLREIEEEDAEENGGDDQDEDGVLRRRAMTFTPDALERIAAIQGTLARSRATINLLQRSVHNLREQLDGPSPPSSSRLTGQIASTSGVIRTASLPSFSTPASLRRRPSLDAGAFLSPFGDEGNNGRIGHFPNVDSTVRENDGSRHRDGCSCDPSHPCIDCRIAAHQATYGWIGSRSHRNHISRARLDPTSTSSSAILGASERTASNSTRSSHLPTTTLRMGNNLNVGRMRNISRPQARSQR